MSPAALGRRCLSDLPLADADRLLPVPLGRGRPLRVDQIPGEKRNPYDCFRELPDMMSAKCSDFLTPSSPCLHLDLIYTVKFTQPP